MGEGTKWILNKVYYFGTDAAHYACLSYCCASLPHYV